MTNNINTLYWSQWPNGSQAAALKKKARTQCVNGHKYTEENTYVWNGSRFCKQCRNARRRELYKRRGV